MQTNEKRFMKYTRLRYHDIHTKFYKDAFKHSKVNGSGEGT
jgi:hypothetical protein